MRLDAEALNALAQRIDRAVLPPVRDPGAMPWFSLVYIVFPLLPAFMSDVVVTDWWRTAFAELLFLPLYFGSFWARGWRRVALLLAIAAIAPALAPANVFSNCFTIYACVLAAFLPLPRMLTVIALSCAMFLAPALVIRESPWLFFMTGVFTGLLAAVCQRVWIHRARANQALRLSQDEVRRLAQVAERERIGRDLHDLLGHSLSVIALKAELATKLFARDPAASAREIADVERIARESLGQVRRAVAGMRALGLRAELANARLALAAVEVDFDYRAAELDLHPELETTLALALREAATNVIRHAGARRCHAELAREESHVTLNVRDDGNGGVRQPGNGLKGMRERIEALGGTLDIESASGQGTRLSMRVPYRPAPEVPRRGETGGERKLRAVG
jgi:two-component system sensor histidine kinase DesK